MPPSLTAKFAGLPRWAWLAILAGGLTIGLIMRSREQAASTTPDQLTDNGDGTYTDANGNIVDAFGNPLTDSYDPNSFSQYGGTIPYPPGSGSASTTFVTPPIPDPRVPCTLPPPTAQVEGYKWICKNGYWEMTPAKHQGTPCDQAPPSKAPKGYKWVCSHDTWQLEPLHSKPPPGSGKVPCATHKPPYKAPHDYHWECKSGYWHLTANHKRGGGHHHHHDGHGHGHGHGNGRGSGNRAPVVTGGGPPADRDIHKPGASGVIAGL